MRVIEEVVGKVQMTREGYLFVLAEGRENDIFVKASKTRGALHGDTVRCAVLRENARGKSAEGEIIKIVERSAKPFVGVLHIVGKQAWVLMQSKTMPYDIEIGVLGADGQLVYGKKGDQPKGALRPTGVRGQFTVAEVYETIDGERSELKAHAGMKVAAVVDHWDRGESLPHGHLTDALGDMGENDTEMHAILAEYGLPYRFEPEVENAADKISDEITEKDLQGRRDFRDILTFTIDPADAKDFDDALSFERLKNGNYEIGVHIADVTYYVEPGTVVDKEALERGTSVYLVDRTVPMMPEKLSNKLCSLRPHEDKLCFSAVFEMSSDGKILGRWFGRTVINSDYRFAYATAQQVIDEGEAALEKELRGGTDGVHAPLDIRDSVLEGCVIPRHIKEAVLRLWEVAKILREQRFASGAISFDRPEMKVEVDEAGKPVNVYESVSKEANWLIEEFMLLANKSVAEFIATNQKMDGMAKKDAKTFVYRIHDEPNAIKLHSVREFAGNFGYKTRLGEDAGDTAKELNALLAAAKDKPEFMAIEMLALRSMAKACYSTDNIGHYGLAFRFYTHFTSPIRRYPDQMVHRLLALYLDGGKSQDKELYSSLCSHCSDREVIAANAERDSIKYKLVEFMEDKVGQEFEGHISGLTEWGMYVEIEPTKIEGMVALREIRSDFYEFDEEKYLIRGCHRGMVYHLGDPVRIRVKSTNLEQRLLDYELIEEARADAVEQLDELGGRQSPQTSSAAKSRQGKSASRSGSSKSRKKH